MKVVPVGGVRPVTGSPVREKVPRNVKLLYLMLSVVAVISVAAPGLSWSVFDVSFGVLKARRFGLHGDADPLGGEGFTRLASAAASSLIRWGDDGGSQPEEEPLSPLRTGGPIEWLHIPKTGTSLGNALVLWACPELSPQLLWVTPKGAIVPPSCRPKFRADPHSRPIWYIGEHTSLTGRSEEELGRVVTMLRYPPARLASGYHWVKERLEKDPGHLNASEAAVCDWVRNSTWAHASRGVMVKMVVGEPVAWRPMRNKHSLPDSRMPGEAAVEEACRRLRKFAFVGIVDYWDASMCLFHKMHGGRMHAVELENVREGGYKSVEEAVREADCGDTADMRLFECGMQIFKEALHAHPQCKHYLAGTDAAQLSI